MKYISRHFLIVFLAFLLIPLLTQANFLDNKEGDSFHKTSGKDLNYVPGELIVVFKAGDEEKSRSPMINKKPLEVIETLSQKKNTVVLKVDKNREINEIISELSKDPSIEHVQLNYIYKQLSPLAINDTYKDDLWGLKNYGQTVNLTSGISGADINIESSWDIVESYDNEVIVAVIDTGVAYNHPDLISAMWDGTSCKDHNGNNIAGGCLYGYNYSQNNNNPMPINNAHGTHIAGTIAATRNNNIGIAGVSSHAKIMAIKTNLTTTSIVKSIDFAIENGAKVINASWGGTEYDAQLFAAVERFVNSGGIFVAAAGNSGQNNDGENAMYPASYDLNNLIAVAATNQSDALASFSNYGTSTVHVAAPGVNILSTGYIQEDFSKASTPNFTNTMFASTGSWQTVNSGTNIYARANSSYIHNDNGELSLISPVNTTHHGDETYLSFYLKANIEDSLGCEKDSLTIEARTDAGIWVSKTTMCGDYDGVYQVNLGSSSESMEFRFVWSTDENGTGTQVPLLDNISISGTNDYYFSNGTSMAAPHVAGLAAKLWSFRPIASADIIVEAIVESGDDLASLVNKTISGKRINVLSALSYLDSEAPEASISYSKENGYVKEGDTLTITAQFNKDISGDNPVLMSITGPYTLEDQVMTRLSATEYKYSHNVGPGDEIALVTITGGNDLYGNPIIQSPVSGESFVVDNTAPTNQDEVFPASVIKQGSSTVDIISSGNVLNEIWFAISETDIFIESATSSRASSGTSTEIMSPSDEGEYRLFVIDAAGNISSSSAAVLTVDNTAPTTPVITGFGSDNIINSYNQSSVEIVGETEDNVTLYIELSDGQNATTSEVIIPNGQTTFTKSININSAQPESLKEGEVLLSVYSTDLAGNVSSLATSTAVLDITVPIIEEVYSQDLNSNGKIDSLVVVFNKVIDESSINILDFDVVGYDNESINASSTVIEGKYYLHIGFDESASYDSSSTPVVKYTKGDLRDNALNYLETVEVVSEDKVPPYVETLGDGTYDFFFTEGTYDIVFSEVIATTSRYMVEDMLEMGADQEIAFQWSENILQITTTATTTFNNKVVITVEDLIGNVLNSKVLINSSIEDYQVEADNDGLITIGNEKEALLVDITKDVVINILPETNIASINLSSFVASSSAITPEIIINSENAYNVQVLISRDSLLSSGSSSWNGIISPPKIRTYSISQISGSTRVLEKAIKIGSDDYSFEIDKAVMIKIPGQANKRVAHLTNGDVFSEITNICSENSEQWSTENLSPSSSCKYNDGSDLIVWTKHFSSFVTYTQTVNPPPPSSSGGGGGGSYTAPTTYCESLSYGPWQECIGENQFREVVYRFPNSCTLTTEQQLETSRTCVIDEVSDLDEPIAEDDIEVIVWQEEALERARKVTEEEDLLVKNIDESLTDRLKGNILLQVETLGQAWYLDPVSSLKYYLPNGEVAFEALRKFGLGITNSDISKIPVGHESRFDMLDSDGDGLPDKLEEALGTDPFNPDSDGDGFLDGEEVFSGYNPLGPGKMTFSKELTERLKGRILLQVESRGEAWYINPEDSKRYYLADGNAAYEIMRYLSLGISNENIRKIGVGFWD